MLRTLGDTVRRMSSIALRGDCTTMQDEPRYAYAH